MAIQRDLLIGLDEHWKDHVSEVVTHALDHSILFLCLALAVETHATLAYRLLCAHQVPLHHSVVAQLADKISHAIVADYTFTEVKPLQGRNDLFIDFFRFCSPSLVFIFVLSLLC